jgi:hypothetical protein
MSTKIALLSSLSLLSLAACDAQVDADHQGTVLASLSGSMRTSEPTTSTAAEVALVWAVPSGGISLVGGETVEVEGSLPAQFTLSIYEPPADELLTDWDGVRFGFAYIVADPAGREDHTAWAEWLGAELDQVLVYLPEAAPAGSAVAGFLDTPSAGFHLYDVRTLTEAERQAQFDCIEELHAQFPDRMPTRAEVYTFCGSATNELTPSAGGLETMLDIEIAAVDFNDLPQPW